MKNPTIVSLGGGNEIGASAYLFRFPSNRAANGSVNILVDSGIRPIEYNPLNYKRIGPNLHRVSHIDFIFLSHAHVDHCGFLPKVFRDFPSARVLMTRPTLELAHGQWDETVRIMERAGKREGLIPLFSADDVLRLVRSVKVFQEWNRLELSPDLSVLPIGAGHILGAVSFLFDYQNGKKTVFHSGDISFTDQLLIPGADSLKLRNPIGTIISESTYLGAPSCDREKEKENFLESIRTILARNGVALIPVFKINRLQEIWETLLRGGIPRNLIALDGDMESLFEIFSRYTAVTMPRKDQFIRDKWERAGRVRDAGPLVVLAHGGMLQQRSPAFKCLRMIVDDPRNGIVANGYMDPCSPGGELSRHVHTGQERILFGEEELTLNCSFHKFSLSAHANGEELEAMASRARDQVIFVHGDGKRVRKYLRARGMRNATCPKNGVEVVL